jgi:sporulation protein YlmC with PRC-barrel domain
MKRFVVSLAAAATVAMTGLALAQEKDDAAESAIPSGVFYKGQQANQYLARDLLLGASVHNETGQIIGDIEDLILNDKNEVEGVIMGTGGFLGAGEKRVGVRLSALKIAEKDGRTVVTLPQASKEVIKALEPYKRAKPSKSLYDRAMEKAEELSERAAETSRDAFQAAKEQAGPALERARERAGEAYDAAREKAKEWTDRSSEPAQPSPPPAEPKKPDTQ